VLVIADPASTAKLSAVPSSIGPSAAALALEAVAMLSATASPAQTVARTEFRANEVVMWSSPERCGATALDSAGITP
jgi:hypothetical protein